MKVLQVMAGDSVGGAETFFVDGVSAIHEEGIQQHVVTRANNEHRIRHLESLGIPLDVAGFGKLWKRPTRKCLERRIAAFGPDIVHSWMGRAGVFSRPGPHVNIGWYGGYYKPGRFRDCQHHVAVTKDIADHIIRQGIPHHRVHVLHIYAEFENSAPLNRSDFDTPDDVPLLLSLSRLHTKKGLDVLIEAMAEIPDAYLWIAGDGPLKNRLIEQTRQLNLDGRIRFLGWRYDREAMLAAADICVFPSRYEPFGAVVIEAWACGIPLVAARAAGPKAYVNHEEDGLLVDIDDVDGLAGSVNRIISDGKLGQRLVKNGRRRYSEGFTKKVFRENVVDLYNHVLG